MSSSISSSDARAEWKLVVFFICCRVRFEAATRAWVRHVELRGADALNVRVFAPAAHAIQTHGGHKTLILGNSLAHDDVRAGILRAGLEKAGRRNPGVFLATPSSSTALHWYYAIRLCFPRHGSLPDEIFICGHPLHFTDSSGNTAKLRAFHLAYADILRAQGDMRGWDEKARFVLSQVSRLRGVPTGIRSRVFGLLVPGHQEMATRLQRLRWNLPAPDAREFNVLDLTSAPDLVESSYKDGFHLNESGARLFSKHFARVLEPLK